MLFQDFWLFIDANLCVLYFSNVIKITLPTIHT